MEIDIVEQRIKDLSPALLKILLSDKTTKKSIRWGTDNYNEYGTEYYTDQEITPDLITGDMTVTIQPRVAKSEAEQNRVHEIRQKYSLPHGCAMSRIT